MTVRLSIISIFLFTSCLFSMEPLLDTESEYESVDFSEVTDKVKYISSLQAWQAFAEKNKYLDDYEVLPKAVAEFQQKYEIKTHLSVLPEVIEIWKNIQHSYAYKQEVWRIHRVLSGGVDAQRNAELKKLQNICLKKAYEQLEKRRLSDEQRSSVTACHCGIAAPIVAGVFVMIMILEFFYLLLPSYGY